MGHRPFSFISRPHYPGCNPSTTRHATRLWGQQCLLNLRITHTHTHTQIDFSPRLSRELLEEHILNTKVKYLRPIWKIKSINRILINP